MIATSKYKALTLVMNHVYFVSLPTSSILSYDYLTHQLKSSEVECRNNCIVLLFSELIHSISQLGKIPKSAAHELSNYKR